MRRRSPCNDPNSHDVFPGGRAGILVQPKKKPMAKSTIPTRLYYVETMVTFDRPELRFPSMSYMHKPEAHSSFSSRLSVRDYRAAMARREEILRGEDDFGSEYVSEVEVYSTDLFGGNPRCERKTVYRVRDAGAEKPVECATESEQFQRRWAAKDTTVCRVAS